MQRVEEPMETIHLYVVREEGKQSYSLPPLFFAFLCLVAIVALTLYSGEHPYFEHETIRVPAQFLPPKYFTTKVLIIPTGIKTYGATTAHGVLTVYNGSIFTQYFPKGVILIANNGIEVITDTSVVVPAGNPPAYGIATVPAHAMISGENGNIPAYDLDQVEGSSIYIRNLQSFTGGRNAYSVTVITSQDRQTAIDLARASLSAQEAHIQAILAKPCEYTSEIRKNTIFYATSTCQFVAYPSLPGMKVTHIRLVGKSFLVDVIYVPRPHIVIAK